MDVFKIVGSFDPDHLERWILEQKRRLNSPWKIAGHCFLVFQKDQEPYVYKSLANVHVDSVKDLFSKFPESFIVCIISEVYIVYTKPKNAKELFPKESLENNQEIKNFKIDYIDNEWKFSVTGNLLTNKTTFSTENIFFNDNDVYQTDDTIILDFTNKHIITKLVDYDYIA